MSKVTLNYNEIRWEDYFCLDVKSPSGLLWVVWNGNHNPALSRNKGDCAGVKAYRSNGQPKTWRVMVKGSSYKVHRIIWCMYNGNISNELVINHKNNNPHDNSLSNLELCTKSENDRRKTCHRTGAGENRGVSGITGVRETIVEAGHHSRYRVYAHASAIGLDGKQRHKKFNYEVYGKETAWELAIAWRRDILLDLNRQGAGYLINEQTENK